MKKQTIPVTINNLHQTKNGCWFFKNHEYIFMNPRNAKNIALPYVDSELQPVLEKLGIPFRENRRGKLEYWDPKNTGMKEVCLPVYIKDEPKYRCIGHYTGTVFTSDSAVYANKLRDEVVNPAVRKFCNEKLASKLKELMSGRKVAGFVGDFRLPFQKEYDIISDDGLRWKILPVEQFSSKSKGAGTIPVRSAYAVFDVNQIELNSEVEMQVPEKSAGLFIGTGGWQIKYWCNKLGLKRIKVVGI